jgi:hypothetical protein
MLKKNFSTLHIILLLSIVVIILFSCYDSPEKDSKQIIKKDNPVLVGDWVRTDASYLIKIIKLNDDRTLEAQYFNPNQINVGKASWEESYGNLKLNIELRDVNYPGSTYTLNYLPDRDILAGDYYQAVEGITFYVEFVRQK